MGVHVITVDNCPDNPAHALADEYYNVSIVEKEAVLRLAQSLDIDGILSFATDPGVVTASFVAEKLGLPSPVSFHFTEILQDKNKFRKFLSDNGFNTPLAMSFDRSVPVPPLPHSGEWFFKPADSAGSKGVSLINTQTSRESDIVQAANRALEYSLSGTGIAEEFIEADGYPSDSECFFIEGKLTFCSFSSQLFKKSGEGRFVPAGFIWDSDLSEKRRQTLREEIQRLGTFCNVGTGLFNVECRIGKDGKPYIMEFSPRGGGNRLAEALEYATGCDLISREICRSLGEKIEPFPSDFAPRRTALLVVHSDRDGIFSGIKYSLPFQYRIKEVILNVEKGDWIRTFRGANDAIGTILLDINDSEKDCLGEGRNCSNLSIEKMLMDRGLWEIEYYEGRFPIGGYFESVGVKGNSSDTFPLPAEKSLGFNTGSSAIEFYIRHYPEKIKYLHLPRYTCPVLIRRLELLGKELRFELKYYNIGEDFLPLWEKVTPGGEGELTIITNYFGICGHRIRKWRKDNPGANLVVDNCQGLFTSPLPGCADIYSIRKFAGVPDGGYLVIDDVIPDYGKKYEELERDHLSKNARHGYLRRNGEIEKGYEAFKEYEKELEEAPLRKISEKSEKEIMGIDFEEERRKRRENFNYLHSCLGKKNGLQLHPLSETDPEVPMVYPLLLKKSGERKRLIDMGIYVPTYWAELPKLRQTENGLNEFEKDLIEFLLPLPIDGRYGEIEMKYIAELYD